VDKDSWFRLEGKTALITGGSSGIGLAIAQAFISLGSHVIILDRAPATAKVAQDLSSQYGVKVRSFAVDVRDRSSLRGVRDTLENEEQGLDILVPNAGINVRVPLLELAPADVEDIVATNLTGVIATLQEFGPLMIGRPGARVVITGSVISTHGMVLRATYAATKAGLSGLTRSLAMEWGPQAVNVNAVGPGIIKTALTDAYMASNPECAEAGVNHTALGRIGTPEEVADAVTFLASHAARFITGQTLYVDGGLSAGSNWW
jgi:NAD(P)-dependent dehydrogenase (short-subunit alcohol dehydrogenase family)